MKTRRVKQRPDVALVNWLNDHGPDKFIVDLVDDAKVVSGVLQSFDTHRAFVKAALKDKVAGTFWKTYKRLNGKLRRFVHTPRVDSNVFYDGRAVYWSLATSESPIALLAAQIDWVLEIMRLGTIERVRLCELDSCSKWYSARQSDQRFCSKVCRNKAFTSDPKFKKEKAARELARYRYHRHNLSKKAGK